PVGAKHEPCSLCNRLYDDSVVQLVDVERAAQRSGRATEDDDRVLTRLPLPDHTNDGNGGQRDRRGEDDTADADVQSRGAGGDADPSTDAVRRRQHRSTENYGKRGEYDERRSHDER